MKIGVIDYGVGNLGSILRALEELRATGVLIDRPADLSSVDRLLLPGVGNFADCMRLLQQSGWTEPLKEQVTLLGRPLLGVCVGMQLLATSSTEGAEEGMSLPGLDLIPGEVRHLRSLGCSLHVPHVGWNEVRSLNPGDGLFSGIADGTDFYFVHSYAFVPRDTSHALALTEHGVPFVAAVRQGRVWGTQFHPERSSKAGFKLLRNFLQEDLC